ncbi:hypothetical protein ACOME3_010017 [Neoechinorhynchus agilis]
MPEHLQHKHYLKTLFPKSTYLKSQIALCNHIAGRLNPAYDIFRELRQTDPYNLEFVDKYADLLSESMYCKDLDQLAEDCNAICKWRRESLYVIGMFYSEKNENVRALEYFHRATRFSPSYSRAWSRCGDECARSGNHNKSLYCYQRAIRINRRDFWSYLGLALAYEVIHYYTDDFLTRILTAYTIRLYDWRVAVTIGDYFYNVNFDPSGY